MNKIKTHTNTRQFKKITMLVLEVSTTTSQKANCLRSHCKCNALRLTPPSNANFRYNVVTDSLDKSGIVPVNLLFDRRLQKRSSAGNLHTGCSPAHKCVNVDKLAISGGITPEIEFSKRSLTNPRRRENQQNERVIFVSQVLQTRKTPDR